MLALNTKIPRLTLFGRSLLLVASEVLVNAGCWIAAGILFARSEETKSILGLALLAWTLGLRHALDADHIRPPLLVLGEDSNAYLLAFALLSFFSAIDNATRGLVGTGQLPVTCGLFFSLGHSTIVIIVNIAIAISTDIANRLDGIGTVGGIIGTAISGSFLFIIAIANTIILIKILRRRRKSRRVSQAVGDDEDDVAYDPKQDHMLMMRIIGPLITFVNKPWKMYPVGILFGLGSVDLKITALWPILTYLYVGFDTTSSIALLAVSALAKKDSKGNAIPARDVVILPFLFTAGMTLIDSLDSILMLYSYSGFPEHSFGIFEKRVPDNNSNDVSAGLDDGSTALNPNDQAETASRNARVKMNMMSGLSIILTLLSILVAFSISLIEIMSVIGENCTPCQNAANADDRGGLAGSWWRGWANAADNSGYIGAAIVGTFVLVVAAWYGGSWLIREIRS